MTDLSSTKSSNSGLARRMLQRYAPYIIVVLFVAIVAYGAVATPAFLTWSNFLNVLIAQTVPAIIALGLLASIISGEFDLSFGLVLSGSMVMCAMLMANLQLHWLLAVLIVLASAVLIGFVNGWLVWRAKFSSIVATLATGGIVGGLALIASDGRTIFDGIPKTFIALTHNAVLGIPLSAWYCVATVALAGFLFRRTVWGREHYAVGEGRAASALAGLAVGRHIIVGFVITAVFSAFGAMVLLSQLGAAPPNAGNSYLLGSFAAVFLGSTLSRHGMFNVAGTIVSVFLIAVATNIAQLLGISVFVQQVLTGLLLLGSVGIVRIANRESAG